MPYIRVQIVLKRVLFPTHATDSRRDEGSEMLLQDQQSSLAHPPAHQGGGDAQEALRLHVSRPDDFE